MFGPGEIMELYEETPPIWVDPWWHGIDPSKDFKMILSKTLECKGIKQEQQAAEYEKAILDGVHHSEDKCTYRETIVRTVTQLGVLGYRCDGAQAVQLWGKTSD